MRTGVVSFGEAESRWGRTGLRRALADGTLRPIARGWYAGPDADASVVSAVRAGGVLGCLSAARHHGLWTPPSRDVHVIVRRQAGARSGAGVVRHSVREWPAVRPVVEPWVALRQVLRHHDAETGLIVVESALHQGVVSLSDVPALTRGLPQRRQHVLATARTDAQSGTETRVRHFLWQRGVGVTPQAFVVGVGRVDLLVGDSWIIECDSVAWHTGSQRYAADRDRDLAVADRRYRITRLTHAQVFDEWETTRRRLSSALQRRWHRLDPG